MNTDDSTDRKQYYEDIFSDGEDENWERAPGKDVIIRVLQHHLTTGNIKNNCKIVDIGCGTGFLLNRILTEVSGNMFDLYGVDFSKKAIEKAETKYPNFHFSCEDGSNTNFDSEYFDIGISYGTYEHFPKPLEGIGELGRILCKGGHFFCMMPTLGIDRTDREDEGWYEERQVEGSPIRQMQWNLKRNTWESYYDQADLRNYPTEESKEFGALKPGVFFFGRKSG